MPDQQPVREPTEAQRLDDLYGLLNSAWMNAEGPERVAFQRAKLSVRVLRQMWDELERQLQEAREQPLCVHCGESPDADNVCADVGLHFRCTDEHHQPGSISLCPHQPVVAHERLRRALEEWAGEKHSETHWMNDWPSYERSCSYCRALTAEAGQQEDK